MKLLLPTCLGLAAVANAWTGDNCKRFADIYTDGADLCRKQALHGRPAPPKRLIGRGWPEPGAAWGMLCR